MKSSLGAKGHARCQSPEQPGTEAFLGVSWKKLCGMRQGWLATPSDILRGKPLPGEFLRILSRGVKLHPSRLLSSSYDQGSISRWRS